VHSIRLLEEEDFLDVPIVDFVIMSLSVEFSEARVEIEGDFAARNNHGQVLDRTDNFSRKLANSSGSDYFIVKKLSCSHFVFRAFIVTLGCLVFLFTFFSGCGLLLILFLSFLGLDPLLFVEL
jgi:cellulose synthase/poly-beta-1,6-N-acetylglucosamine synthase-like glycosyltransferase